MNAMNKIKRNENRENNHFQIWGNSFQGKFNGTPAAIKIMTDDQEARNELRKLRDLNHVNVIEFLGFKSVRNELFIAMKLADTTLGACFLQLKSVIRFKMIIIYKLISFNFINC